MYYKSCPHCGSHLDPNERCDCQSSSAARTIRTAAYNETFSTEYKKSYSAMSDKRLPPCIADDIANMEARKKAAAVATSTVNSYQTIKRRV